MLNYQRVLGIATYHKHHPFWINFVLCTSGVPARHHSAMVSTFDLLSLFRKPEPPWSISGDLTWWFNQQEWWLSLMGNNDGQSFRMYPQVVIYSLLKFAPSAETFEFFQPSNSIQFPRLFFPSLQTQILQSSHRTKQLRWTTSCARATTSRWPATACMALPPSWSSPSKAVHSRDRGDRAITGITWNLMRDSSQDIFRGYDSRKMLILIDFVQMYHMSYGHMRQDWGPVKTGGDCWQLAMALLGGILTFFLTVSGSLGSPWNLIIYTQLFRKSYFFGTR